MSLPSVYVEAQTAEGGVNWQLYENHPTPSGCDRPYLRLSGNFPIPLDRLRQSIRCGVPFFLDGQPAGEGEGKA